jgi:hypothetical protein
MATDDAGSTVGVDRPYEQATYAMEAVVDAVEVAGESVEDGVRIRLYVVESDDGAGD